MTPPWTHSRCVSVAVVVLLCPNTIAFVAPGVRPAASGTLPDRLRAPSVAPPRQRRSTQPQPWAASGRHLRAGEAVDEAGELERFFFDRAEIFVR